jgi:hypothetical protein
VEFKSKRVVSVGNAAHTREMINAAQIVIANSIRKIPLEIICNIILKCIRLLTGFV